MEEHPPKNGKPKKRNILREEHITGVANIITAQVFVCIFLSLIRLFIQSPSYLIIFQSVFQNESYCSSILFQITSSSA
jgi:hypothetical protein